jgi:hypothetical protein
MPHAACRVYLVDAGVPVDQSLGPLVEIERVMRLLADNGLHILQQLRVVNVVPIGPHNANKKALKVRDIYP